jgi:cell wall-associated NlpC family hydrolase
MPVQALPDIAALVDPLLGASYEQYNCWHLVRHLFKAGWDIDFDADPAHALAQAGEIWFQGDPTDPLTLTQPWDVIVMRTKGIASSHVGIVVDTQYFVHTRKSIGVSLEPLKAWAPPRSTRLLQIARLKRLL